MSYTYKMKYYSVTMRKEIVLFSEKWKELESMLSEMSQT
jgi:hypothetical protein